MMKQVIGWILLIAGLAIIFWGIYSSYQIFAVKTAAPEIFKVEKAEADLSQKEKVLGSQEMIEKMMGEQLRGIFPTDSLPQLFNLIAWSIFAMILFFGGGKISEIGIKLIK